jgi:hypothetical protein
MPEPCNSWGALGSGGALSAWGSPEAAGTGRGSEALRFATSPRPVPTASGRGRSWFWVWSRREIWRCLRLVLSQDMAGLKAPTVWDARSRDAPKKAWARDGVMWQSEAPLNPSPRPSLLTTEPQKTKNATKVAFFQMSQDPITGSWLCCADLLGKRSAFAVAAAGQSGV